MKRRLLSEGSQSKRAGKEKTGKVVERRGQRDTDNIQKNSVVTLAQVLGSI